MKILERKFSLVVSMALLVVAGSSMINTAAGEENPADRKGLLPEFQLEVMDENFNVTRGSLEGRFYIIYFWGTECQQCKDDIQNLQKVYEEVDQESFEILSISADRKEENVRRYQEVFSMPWYHTVIGGDPNLLVSVAKTFEIENWPYALLISPEGNVISTYKSVDKAKLESEIRSAMN